jgi:hypothetical protein
VESGAARLVNDYDELFAAIDDVLDRQSYDVAEQRRILRRKCLYTSDASDRISAFLQHYAERELARRSGLHRLLRPTLRRMRDLTRTTLRRLSAG